MTDEERLKILLSLEERRLGGKKGNMITVIQYSKAVT